MLPLRWCLYFPGHCYWVTKMLCGFAANVVKVNVFLFIQWRTNVCVRCEGEALRQTVTDVNPRQLENARLSICYPAEFIGPVARVRCLNPTFNCTQLMARFTISYLQPNWKVHEIFLLIFFTGIQRSKTLYDLFLATYEWAHKNSFDWINDLWCQQQKILLFCYYELYG